MSLLRLSNLWIASYPVCLRVIGLIVAILFSLPGLTAQKAMQEKARTEGWLVADMHYHVSTKSYNRFALKELHPKIDELNKALSDYTTSWPPYDVSDALFRRIQDSLGISDQMLWSDELKGLKFLYDGKVVRPKQKSNHLKNYDQATHPRSYEGNVKLGFNAFVPFEYKTAESYGDQLYHSLFVSKASMKWLKKVGDWNRMTHFDNLLYEHAFNKAQETDSPHRIIDEAGNEVLFKWKYLRSGTELQNDSNTYYVVNVIEGGHALQHTQFHPERDGFRLWLPRSVKRLHRKKVIDYDAAVFKRDIENPRHLEQLANLGVDTTKSYLKIDTNNRRMLRILRRADISYDRNELADTINKELKNTIITLKKLDPPIFMVTVGHFSYNGMVNHALALNSQGIGGSLLRRIYRVRVDDDPNFVREWEDKFYAPPSPVTDFGRTLIWNLLDTMNGHRIHIDLKHSGYPMRAWFYDKADSLAAAGHRDTLRPICSHCAATGLSINHYSPIADEYAYADSRSIMPFSPFSINLYDEEIEKICALGGIIGITLHEGRLGGYQSIKKRKKQMKNRLKDLWEEKDRAYIRTLKEIEAELEISEDKARKVLLEDYISAEPFLQNLFYILLRSKKKRSAAWRHVCIGSDLDGIINPIDIVPTAAQYPYFRNRLQQFIPIFMELNGDYYDPDDFYLEEAVNGEKAFPIKEGLDFLFYRSLRNFVRDNFLKSGL